MIQLDDSSEQKLDTPPRQGAIVTSRVSPLLKSVVYPLGRYIVLPFYFGQIQVSGQEHLPATNPVILAPTHRSRWDALVVPYAAGAYVTGRHPRFMVSANEMAGLQGWFIRRLGGFPIDTDQPGIGSFRHAVELLNEGEMVVIFPEGKIFRDDRVHPLKRGLARMALQVESIQPGIGVQIVPISIHYSQPVPHWRCDVKIDIGSTLQVAEYYSTSVKKSAKQLTADLEIALKQVHEDSQGIPEPIGELS